MGRYLRAELRGEEERVRDRKVVISERNWETRRVRIEKSLSHRGAMR